MNASVRRAVRGGATFLAGVFLLALVGGVSLTDRPIRAGASGDSPLTAPPAVAWQSVASPNTGSESNYLSAVAAVGADDLWAAGYYISAGGTQTLVLHWDGTRWTRVPSPNLDAHYNALVGITARATNDVWAVGSFYGGNHAHRTLILHWDGANWTVVSSPNPGPSDNRLQGVAAVAANDAWAVGAYLGNGGDQALILHWDGVSWAVVPGPFSGTRYTELIGVTAVAANDVWAVGSATPPYRPTQTLTLHWDGVSWTIVPSPNIGAADHLLARLAAVASDDIWAAGVYYGRNGDQPLMLHWDGTRWLVVPSPTPGTIGHHRLGVAAVAANDVWAVGFYMNHRGADQPLVLHWDGTRWTVVPSPDPGPTGSGLAGVAAVAPNDIWAVGYTCCEDTIRQTLTVHYALVQGTSVPPGR